MKKIILSLAIAFAFCSKAMAWNDQGQVNQYNIKFSSGALTTTVKTGGGMIHTLTISGGTASTLDIYDGAQTQASLMYSFTSTNTINSYLLDGPFTSGCVVVTGGNGLKWTVTYR